MRLSTWVDLFWVVHGYQWQLLLTFCTHLPSRNQRAQNSHGRAGAEREKEVSTIPFPVRRGKGHRKSPLSLGSAAGDSASASPAEHRPSHFWPRQPLTRGTPPTGLWPSSCRRQGVERPPDSLGKWKIWGQSRAWLELAKAKLTGENRRNRVGRGASPPTHTPPTPTPQASSPEYTQLDLDFGVLW